MLNKIISGYVLLFLHKICSGNSFEAPHQGTSNEYLQLVFLWRNKQNFH